MWRTISEPIHKVPDEQTAIAIAERILASAYGRKNMEGSRPYKATLVGNIWRVHGTAPKEAVGLEPLGISTGKEDVL